MYGKATAVPFANATQLTIHLWLKIVVGAASQVIFETSTNYGVGNSLVLYWDQPTHRLVFGAHDAVGYSLRLSAVGAVDTVSWVRVTMVLDQTLASLQTALYLNGSASGTIQSTDSHCLAGIATDDLYIGMRGAATFPFTGNVVVDRITIGKAYSAAEVLSEYQTGRYPTGGTILANYAWNPNTSFTSIVDSGTGAKNIALTNSPVWTTDTPSQARPQIRNIPYSLRTVAAGDVGNGGVRVTDSPALRGSTFSLEFYVNLPAAAGTYETLFLKSSSGAGWSTDGWAITRSPGQLGFIFWVNSWPNGPSINIHPGWNHIVCTYAAKVLSIYRDGALLARTTVASDMVIATADLLFGWSGSVYYHFGGSLAAVRYYNRNLTPAEIRSVYLTGRPVTANLVASWDGVEGSGTALSDSAGGYTGVVAPTLAIWNNDTPSHPRVQDNEVPSTISGVQLWCRADRGLTIVNGTVASWADLSGHTGRALTQATVANQPRVVVGAAGQPAVLFDGVNDYLQAAFTLVQPSTVFIVYRHVTIGTAGKDGVFDGTTDTTMFMSSYNVPPKESKLYAGSPFTSAAPIIAEGSYAHAVLTFNGVSSKIRVNGVDVVSSGTGASAGQGFTLGGNALGTRTTNIEVCEVIVTSTVPSAAEIAALEAYFNNRYNTVLSVDFTSQTPGALTTLPGSLVLTRAAGTAASETVQTGTSTVVTAGMGANIARVGRRLDTDKAGLVLEETRINNMIWSRLPNNAGLTAGSLDSYPTTNNAQPDGGTAGVEVVVTSVGFSRYRSLGAISGTYTASEWVLKGPGAGTYQLTNQETALPNTPPSTSTAGTAATAYARVMTTTVLAGGGAYLVPQDARNEVTIGGVAAANKDAVIDMMQWESGKWASEFIYSVGADSTRQPERLYHPSAASLILGGRLAISFTLRPKSTAANFTAASRLWTSGADYAEISTAGVLTISIGGVTNTTSAIVWAQYDTLDIYVAAGGSQATQVWYRVNNGATQAPGIAGAVLGNVSTASTTIDLLCNGTANQFSAWITNITVWR